MKKIHICLFVGILLFVGQVHAQRSGFNAGYVVTLSNDTIPGMIRDRSVVSNCQIAVFIDEQNVKTRYRPRKLKGYTVGGTVYRSFVLPTSLIGQSAFMIELASGRFTLYLHYRQRQSAGTDANGVVFNDSWVEENYYLQMGKSERVERIRSLGFRSQMRSLLADDEMLAARLSTKEFRYRDIEELISIYNRNFEEGGR